MTAEELIATGADPEAVGRLHVRHRGHGGRPSWRLSEALDQLDIDAWKGGE